MLNKIIYELFPDDISFEGFNYTQYHRGEAEILRPQMEVLGYSQIVFSMGEYDSFGPLTRVCNCIDPKGERRTFVYG